MKKYINNKKQEGFTLIEMMVVIAVIGILSAAVLAGLGPSRAKARDARIMSGLNQIRTLAETVYNPISNDPYSGLPTAAADVKKDTESQGTTVTIDVNTKFQFFALAPLASDSTKIFCVDSSGYAGLKSNASAGSPCSGAPGGGGGGGGVAKGLDCIPPDTAKGEKDPCVSGSSCTAETLTVYKCK